MSVTILRKVSVSGGTVLRAANNLGDVASAATAFGNIKQAATTSATGVVELATNAEAATGTDTSRAITPAAMKAGMADEINARAFGQGVVLNGTTAPTSSLTIGTSPFTVDLDFDVETSGDVAKFAFVTSRTSGQGRSFYVLVYGGDLLITLLGATGSDVRRATVAGFQAAYAGQRVKLTITRSDTTLALFLNGFSLAYTETTSGTAPTWADTINATVSELGSYGNTLHASGFLAGNFFNRCLTSAQVLSLMKHGVDAADVNSAGTELVTGDNSTFASDTGFWTKSGATISGGACALAANGDYISKASLLTIGKRYRVTLNVSAYTALMIAGSSAGSGYIEITSTGAKSGEFVATNTTFSIYTNGAATFDDVTLTPIGAVLLPDPDAAGNGLIWNDVSGNGAHIVLPTSGVAWAKPSNRANRIRGTTNTNGNQALLGGGTILPAGQITLIRGRSRSGTPNITLGTASGGSQLVASVALSTTWKDLTIALTGGIVSTADDVWVGSDSTDVVEIDITWEPLGF